MLVITAAHSRFVLARMIPTETTEDLLLGMWQLFQPLGRVPKRLIWDNERGIGRGPHRAEGVPAFVPTTKVAPADRLEADRAGMLALPPVPPIVGGRSQVRLGRDNDVTIVRMVDAHADLDRIHVRLDGRPVTELGSCPASSSDFDAPGRSSSTKSATDPSNKTPRTCSSSSAARATSTPCWCSPARRCSPVGAGCSQTRSWPPQ